MGFGVSLARRSLGEGGAETNFVFLSIIGNAFAVRFVLIVLSGLATTAFAVEDIHVRVRGSDARAIKFQNNGIEQEKKGDLVSARKNLDEAIRLDPKLWPAYYNRACIDMKQHKWELAVQDAGTALRGRPTFVSSALVRAWANQKLKRYDASLAELDHLISILRSGKPYIAALNSAAWIRATCPDASFRNGHLAISQARTGCEATAWKNAEIIDTLAVAYAETGDFDSALRFQERAFAVEQSSKEHKPELIEHMSKHLESFKQHRPWREISK
jgi:tetratricopeptide (TPR) repeat protein